MFTPVTSAFGNLSSGGGSQPSQGSRNHNPQNNHNNNHDRNTHHGRQQGGTNRGRGLATGRGGRSASPVARSKGGGGSGERGAGAPHGKSSRGGRGGGRGGAEAKEHRRTFKINQPPVFRGILDGSASNSNNDNSSRHSSHPPNRFSSVLGGTPLPRSMQQQQQQQPTNAGGTFPSQSTPPASSSSVFGNSAVLTQSPLPSAPLPSPSRAAAQVQDGVLGGGPASGTSSPSPTAGLPQYSAIAPGSEASLSSMPSPSPFSASAAFSPASSGVLPSGASPTPFVFGAGTARPAAPAPSPTSTSSFAAFAQSSTGQGTPSPGGFQGLLTSTPQRTPAGAETTGMPAPAPQVSPASHSAFGSLSQSAVATPPTPAAKVSELSAPAPLSTDTTNKRGRAGDDDAVEKLESDPGVRAEDLTKRRVEGQSVFSAAQPAQPRRQQTSQGASVFASALAPATPTASSSAFGAATHSAVAKPTAAPTRHSPPSHSGAATRMGVPSAPSIKAYCIAARLFSECASILLSPSPSEHEKAGPLLARIFFDPIIGRAGVCVNFEETASEMLAVWQSALHLRDGGHTNQSKKADANSMTEQVSAAWAAAVAIGAQLNMVCTALQRARSIEGSTSHHNNNNTGSSGSSERDAYINVVVANPDDAMRDACKQANRLTHIIKFFFTHQDVCFVPFSALSPLIRRVRATFEEAQLHAEGEPAIASDLPSALRTTFRTINTRVRGMMKGPTLVVTSPVEQAIVMAYAHLVLEMMAADISNSEDVVSFMAAFHKACPDALEERFSMYYHVANSYLTSAFAFQAHVHEAARLLAHALVLCPADAPDATQRRLFGQLAAAKLACGAVPQPDDLRRYQMPELLDVVAAVRAASLDLMDVALRRHAAFFVELGVHNMLELARDRISLLLVVKYFQHRKGEQQLHVNDMVAYFGLPYRSAVEANFCWLLPLLMKKCINGVLDGSVLILSKKDPFPEYPRDLVLAEQGEVIR